MHCPKCGAVALAGARFCELDGTRLAADSCRCGAGPEAQNSQGYCTQCGLRWQTPGRGHEEIALAPNLARPGSTPSERPEPRLLARLPRNQTAPRPPQDD